MTATADHLQSGTEHKIAFIRLPRAVDVANDRGVLDMLTAVLASNPSVVVADGTRTGACDCAGIAALICAHRKAAAAGAQLRVVATSRQMRRIITLTRAHEVLDVYLTMDAALSDIPSAATPEAATADPAQAQAAASEAATTVHAQAQETE